MFHMKHAHPGATLAPVSNAADPAELQDPQFPQAWSPDAQLVPALLAGSSTRLTSLKDLDRCWAVAGLRAHGRTMKDIADLLKCSQRMVCKIAARTETQAFFYAATETEAFAGELALRDSALRLCKADLEQAVCDRDRYRTQRDNLIDAQIVGTPSCGRCGTPWDRGNTYWALSNGRRKRFCRECARRRQKARRDASREAVAMGIVDGALPLQPLVDMAECILGPISDRAGVPPDSAGRTSGDTSPPP